MKGRLLLVLLISLSGSFLFSQSQGLEIGNQAPEIRLPSSAGDTVSLSFFKGKVVLIDFWASWCGPCVQEQPYLVQLYKKYRNHSFTHGDGFEIYAVSLDSKKSLWQNAIARLDITWTQVSDLKYWRSPIARAYSVQELPFNLLIDRNGIIISRNLHGSDLERKLATMKIK